MSRSNAVLAVPPEALRLAAGSPLASAAGKNRDQAQQTPHSTSTKPRHPSFVKAKKKFYHPKFNFIAAELANSPYLMTFDDVAKNREIMERYHKVHNEHYASNMRPERKRRPQTSVGRLDSQGTDLSTKPFPTAVNGNQLQKPPQTKAGIGVPAATPTSSNTKKPQKKFTKESAFVRQFRKVFYDVMAYEHIYLVQSPKFKTDPLRPTRKSYRLYDMERAEELRRSQLLRGMMPSDTYDGGWDEINGLDKTLDFLAANAEAFELGDCITASEALFAGYQPQPTAAPSAMPDRQANSSGNNCTTNRKVKSLLDLALVDDEFNELAIFDDYEEDDAQYYDDFMNEEEMEALKRPDNAQKHLNGKTTSRVRNNSINATQFGKKQQRQRPQSGHSNVDTNDKTILKNSKLRPLSAGSPLSYFQANPKSPIKSPTLFDMAMALHSNDKTGNEKCGDQGEVSFAIGIPAETLKIIEQSPARESLKNKPTTERYWRPVINPPENFQPEVGLDGIPIRRRPLSANQLARLKPPDNYLKDTNLRDSLRLHRILDHYERKEDPPANQSNHADNGISKETETSQQLPQQSALDD